MQTPTHFCHSEPFCPMYPEHYICSWVLVSFPKPTGCLTLHLPEFFTIFWQPSAVSQSEMSAPLSSFKNPNISSSSSGKECTSSTGASSKLCLCLSSCHSVHKENTGRCKISLQSKKWMSHQTILYWNPN